MIDFEYANKIHFEYANTIHFESYDRLSAIRKFGGIGREELEECEITRKVRYLIPVALLVRRLVRIGIF